MNRALLCLFASAGGLAASAVSLGFASMATAQQTAPPAACVEGVYDDFDFWVGDWNVYAPDGGQYLGQNTITKINGGCLIQEHWVGAGGNTGDSINIHDPLIGAWRQVWMSNGWYIDYTGGLNEDGGMVLTGEAYTIPTETRAGFRGTWTPNEDGTVTQFFEQQDAEGNWQGVFVGIYVPKEDDPRAAEAAAARGE